MTDKTKYEPREKTAAILDRAYELVTSVAYQVSARWLFYRLLQEGFYSAKTDYKNKFLPAVSAARHAFYKSWRPDTLADETREIVERGGGFASPEEWLTTMKSRVRCVLDKWYNQPYFLQLWFEARAMLEQFSYYAPEFISLVPMGGQPSIPYKWQIAKRLEEAAEEYQKPLVVLYFGDLDKAGDTISQTVRNDVQGWCSAPFEFTHCGLTLAQVQQYGVPENPEKPGEYQWEALPDAAAAEIIRTYTAPFISHDAFSAMTKNEQAAMQWLRGQLGKLEMPIDLKKGDVA